MKALFVAPTRPSVGLTSAALGVVRALERTGLKVGFCKPIAQDYTAVERSVHFAREVGRIPVPDPIPLERAERLLTEGQTDDLMEEVVRVYAQAAEGADAVVVEGLALHAGNPYAAQLNAELARNLEAAVILVASLQGSTPKEVADQMELMLPGYGDAVAGYILNYAPPADQSYTSKLRSRRKLLDSKLTQLGSIPVNPAIAAPRVADVARHLGATVVNAGEMESRRVQKTFIAARSVPNIVNLFTPGALVITSGDREDVVMAASLAHLSGVPLAGLLLTWNYPPEEPIQRLCRVALTSSLPVLMVETDTYTTAGRLNLMDTQIPLDDLERVERVLDYVADKLELTPLLSRIAEPHERRMTPPAFRYELIKKASAARKRIVLPEGDEPRTVRAAAICHEKGIAQCILLAKPDSVHAVAEAQGVKLPSSVQIIDPDAVRAKYIGPMVELRKHKGLTDPMAEQQLEDSVVLGTMMLALGEVDGLVSGAIHTTANTIRPALQLIKTAPSAALVSSVFFMLMPDQVLVYGDCAVNPDPTPEELADIAIQSADSAAAFGIVPRVAMISYSTGTSGAGDDVEKVARATQIAKSKRPDLMIDGPLQYDAASVESVGRQKAPGSPVAGRATVFIFPDLNTGNTTYKAVQRSAGVVSVGPMLQGLRKPVNDLSRGALVDDIVYTIALTAIQATQVK
ncbi:MAG: phosphate acetyltransferase [Meiothermus sp.]|nr:phosphate acetyltransferase [Meiothermus sp.]